VTSIHPGWGKLSRLPADVVICPRCGAPHQDKDHNWKEDAISGATTCTRPSCLSRGRLVLINAAQRRYPPTAH
jgi:hypothetical protein